MRTIAFDGRTGAAGDMVLGALVAAGADADVLAPVERALPVRYEFDRVDRNGVSAVRAHVVHADAEETGDTGGDGRGHDSEGSTDHSHDHSHDNDHSHDHPHDDGHSHDHSHDDGHSHDHGAEGHGPQRTYAEVVEVVEGMDLPDAALADALAAFEILAEAEASVHGTDVEDTHFHEVGADDAIADVVGASLLFDDLAPERVVTTPLSTGDGEVEFSHGVYPVPVPAVVEIAERADWSLRGGPVDAELLTPTGAAILARFAEGVERLPPLRIESSGYGAGGRTFPDRPNVLRAVVGDGGEPLDGEADAEIKHEAAHRATAGSGEGRLVRDDVAVLETNLDDASPELLGGLQESLAEAGAHDVTVLPATMKKSRPGHLVKAICDPADAERVARRLAEETGTLGVREGGARHRWIAERRFETAEVTVGGDRGDDGDGGDAADGDGGPSYEIPVKVASDADGAVYDVSAEYDDAAAAARDAGLPVREVLRRAEAAVHEALGSEAAAARTAGAVDAGRAIDEKSTDEGTTDGE